MPSKKKGKRGKRGKEKENEEDVEESCFPSKSLRRGGAGKRRASGKKVERGREKKKSGSEGRQREARKRRASSPPPSAAPTRKSRRLNPHLPPTPTSRAPSPRSARSIRRQAARERELRERAEWMRKELARGSPARRRLQDAVARGGEHAPVRVAPSTRRSDSEDEETPEDEEEETPVRDIARSTNPPLSPEEVRSALNLQPIPTPEWLHAHYRSGEEEHVPAGHDQFDIDFAAINVSAHELLIVLGPVVIVNASNVICRARSKYMQGDRCFLTTKSAQVFFLIDEDSNNKTSFSNALSRHFLLPPPSSSSAVIGKEKNVATTLVRFVLLLFTFLLLLVLTFSRSHVVQL